jgi:iron complex transport system substrate-binding protein
MESCKHQVISLLYSIPEEKQEYITTVQSLEYIEKAIDLMHTKINEMITLQQICERLNISVHHFIRIFKAYQGTSPMKYFMRLKIDAAANMLLETNTTVSDISEILNYSNVGHFCRTFKKYFGSNSLRHTEIAKYKIYRQRKTNIKRISRKLISFYRQLSMLHKI